jgi:hypothetical protein
MALIQCPECSKTVSNTAPACPHCGVPIALASAERMATGTPVSTILLTPKSLKLQIVIAALFFWVGVIWFIAALSRAEWTSASTVGGFLLFFFGAVWYIATKIFIWWHHK